MRFMGYREHQVLDKGYVRLIEAWGGGESKRWQMEKRVGTAEDFECGIIEAARQSTQGSFRGWTEDEKLLNFLYSNKPPHATPFEFAGMILEIQLPIFVTREWHRHRTQSYNEMSARYSPLPDLNYVPTKERLFMMQEKNKQAQAVKGSDDLTEQNADKWLMNLEGMYIQLENFYQFGLNMGIPKEVARIAIPVGRYTRMRASANLRNWLGFLTLRMDPNAQWEIRQYANVVGGIISEMFPRTWKQFSLQMKGETNE